MSTSAALISRNRLRWIPRKLRLAHEYSFFLHDQGAQLLVQYEQAKAHIVKVNFRSKVEADLFSKLAETDSIEAMRATGYPNEARRVILNTITMGMVSDCLHHVYEALRCLEKRKTIVALNLLRKPLTDNLMYLSWMLGDEDAFYAAFTSPDTNALTPSRMGNNRAHIIEHALGKTQISDVLNTDFINRSLFDKTNASGFYKLFQHAVHLITVRHMELRTAPENFNFIFKRYTDDDIYEVIYDIFPQLLLYLSHVILELYDRVKPMEKGAKRAFVVRSVLGLYVVEGGENEISARERLSSLNELSCSSCKTGFNLTTHNIARIVLSESYRCTKCRKVQGFPFSWMF